MYRNDEDREEWLAVLSEVCERFNWVLHAWCQMTKQIEWVSVGLFGCLSQLNERDAAFFQFQDRLFTV